MAFSVFLPAAAIFLATRSSPIISIREYGEDVTCEDSVIVRSAHGDGADGIIDSFISERFKAMLLYLDDVSAGVVVRVEGEVGLRAL